MAWHVFGTNLFPSLSFIFFIQKDQSSHSPLPRPNHTDFLPFLIISIFLKGPFLLLLPIHLTPKLQARLYTFFSQAIVHDTDIIHKVLCIYQPLYPVYSTMWFPTLTVLQNLHTLYTMYLYVSTFYITHTTHPPQWQHQHLSEADTPLASAESKTYKSKESWKWKLTFSWQKDNFNQKYFKTLIIFLKISENSEHDVDVFVMVFF